MQKLKEETKRIDRSEIAEGVHVPEDCRIGSGVTLGRDVTIGDRVTVHPEVRIGDSTQIGDGAVVYRVPILPRSPGPWWVQAVSWRMTSIGVRCKVQAGTYVTACTTLEDDVFIAPMVMTANNSMG